jgi:hypothetical protein
MTTSARIATRNQIDRLRFAFHPNLRLQPLMCRYLVRQASTTNLPHHHRPRSPLRQIQRLRCPGSPAVGIVRSGQSIAGSLPSGSRVNGDCSPLIE